MLQSFYEQENKTSCQETQEEERQKNKHETIIKRPRYWGFLL